MSTPNKKMLLKRGGLIALALFIMMVALWWGGRSAHTHSASTTPGLFAPHNTSQAVTASADSAAESLNTLTEQWRATEKRVKQVMDTNTQLQQQNKDLQRQYTLDTEKNRATLSQQVTQLQTQVRALTNHPVPDHNASIPMAKPLTHIPELSTVLSAKPAGVSGAQHHNASLNNKAHTSNALKPVYTIPANATAVQNRLMTALVGRLPIKGVVTDPYPFKIVFANDTLAANGWRVPHLQQMIVSGYSEGDLNLLSVRGWVTSLTFVFEDGTICSTTSNDNNLGRFTKEGALGYLSDATGNPFIRGRLITNAPTYLGVNVALGAAQGAANAFAQSQTTNDTNAWGTSSSSVTGSAGTFVAAQAAGQGMSQVQQWWRDRMAQSFDAIYVPTVTANGDPQTVVVNFAREIPIDYNPQGRKVTYAPMPDNFITTDLD